MGFCSIAQMPVAAAFRRSSVSLVEETPPWVRSFEVKVNQLATTRSPRPMMMMKYQRRKPV